MLKLLLFCVLFVLCWPLALVALVLYPIVWLLLLPLKCSLASICQVLAARQLQQLHLLLVPL